MGGEGQRLRISIKQQFRDFLYHSIGAYGHFKIIHGEIPRLCENCPGALKNYDKRNVCQPQALPGGSFLSRLRVSHFSKRQKKRDPEIWWEMTNGNHFSKISDAPDFAEISQECPERVEKDWWNWWSEVIIISWASAPATLPALWVKRILTSVWLLTPSLVEFLFFTEHRFGATFNLPESDYVNDRKATS